MGKTQSDLGPSGDPHFFNNNVMALYSLHVPTLSHLTIEVLVALLDFQNH